MKIYCVWHYYSIDKEDHVDGNYDLVATFTNEDDARSFARIFNDCRPFRNVQFGLLTVSEEELIEPHDFQNYAKSIFTDSILHNNKFPWEEEIYEHYVDEYEEDEEDS